MFANFERMRRELDALFGDLPGGGGRSSGGAFSPPVDVYYVADPPRAVVHVELAGIRPAELELTVRGRELILAGVRRPPGAARSASTSSSRFSTAPSGGRSRSAPTSTRPPRRRATRTGS